MLFLMHGFTHQKRYKFPWRFKFQIVEFNWSVLQFWTTEDLRTWGLEDTLQVHTKKILSCFSLCSQSRTTVPKRTCCLIYQLNSLQDIWESRKSKQKIKTYSIHKCAAFVCHQLIHSFLKGFIRNTFPNFHEFLPLEIEKKSANKSHHFKWNKELTTIKLSSNNLSLNELYI